MSTSEEIIVGGFFPQPVTGKLVFVSVYATRSVQGEATVLDEDGQFCFTASFELAAEGDALELEVADLSPGKYLVRLDMEGRVWERGLRIGD